MEILISASKCVACGDRCRNRYALFSGKFILFSFIYEDKKNVVLGKNVDNKKDRTYYEKAYTYVTDYE